MPWVLWVWVQIGQQQIIGSLRWHCFFYETILIAVVDDINGLCLGGIVYLWLLYLLR